MNGQHCKHRVALLVGDLTSVVDVDTEAVDALRALTAGSPIVAAIDEIAAAEKAVTAAQRRLKSAKQALATAILG